MKFATVKLSDILIEDRTRQDMGELSELAFSIKERGLIQPLAVQEVNGKYRLLAGGRRYAALKRLEKETVGVRVYEGELSRLEIKSIELAENFHRKDLTFLETSNLQREIHELQLEIHGQKSSGGRPDMTGEKEGWDMAKTADLLGVSPAQISQNIQIAKAAEAFPELFADALTRSDATKILQRISNQLKHEELAKQVEEQRLVGWKQQLINSYILGDFFEKIKDVPDKSIDLCEVDPPYAIDLKQQKKGYCYGPSYNEVCQDVYLKFLSDAILELYRVMADHSWLIFWFGPEPYFELVYSLLHNSGFVCTRLVGIWTKTQGQSMRPDMYLASSYEMFFYARKGSPRIVKQGRLNNFSYTGVAPQKKIHPTERPIELMQDILETFAWEGSRVLVPFLGSGNTLLAAHNVKMNGFGFELSEEYRNNFILRVNEMEV